MYIDQYRERRFVTDRVIDLAELRSKLISRDVENLASRKAEVRLEDFIAM